MLIPLCHSRFHVFGSEEQIVRSFPLYYRGLTGVKMSNLQERSMLITDVSTHTTAAPRGVMNARNKRCRSGHDNHVFLVLSEEK